MNQEPEPLSGAKRDILWGRIDAWLRRGTVRESFLETFELMDQLCEALAIAENYEADNSRRLRSEQLIKRAREVTGA